MVDDEIDVDVLADCEVDDTVDVDMKVGNEGDVADDDKDVEEVEALENIVIVEEGAWDININHSRKCFWNQNISQFKVYYTIVVISVVVVVDVVDFKVDVVFYFTVVTFSLKFSSAF